MALGPRLREERAEQDLSLADLREQTGLSRGYLSRVENEKQIPAPEYVEQIADALGLDSGDLLAERDVSEYIRRGLDPAVAEVAVELNRMEPARRKKLLGALQTMLDS